jgi:hypothetical protein
MPTAQSYFHHRTCEFADNAFVEMVNALPLSYFYGLKYIFKVNSEPLHHSGIDFNVIIP